MNVFDHIKDIFLELHEIAIEKTDKKRLRKMTVTFLDNRIKIDCDDTLSEKTTLLYKKLTEPSNDEDRECATFFVTLILRYFTLRGVELRKINTENADIISCFSAVHRGSVVLDIYSTMSLLLSKEEGLKAQTLLEKITANQSSWPEPWVEFHSDSVETFCQHVKVSTTPSELAMMQDFFLIPDVFAYIIMNEARLSRNLLTVNAAYLASRTIEEDNTFKCKFISHLEKQKLMCGLKTDAINIPSISTMAL